MIGDFDGCPEWQWELLGIGDRIDDDGFALR
jgi:hypothetical protein